MLKIVIILIAMIQFIAPKTLIFNVFNDEDNEVMIKTKNDPPPHTDYARVARWLVHNSEWMSTGTISTLPSIEGFPMVNVISMADSQKGAKSTGSIYFYLVMLDFTAQDLSKKNQMTALFSMDQNLYCTQRNIDPMEPTCARIMISGEVLRVEKGTDEFNFAASSMTDHHPASANWIDAHDFFLCKLNISQIVVLDWYGGPHFVDIQDYYKANIDNLKEPKIKLQFEF